MIAPDPLADLDSAAQDLAGLRGRPLLVLFYPDNCGQMHQHDTEDIYKEMRSAGLSKEAKVESVDVLLHTLGGDPHAGYRIAQVLRRFSSELIFLVPAQAYSAGTLLTLAGNWIELGDYAGLSPIDLRLIETSTERPRIEVELASIGFFMEFAQEARESIEKLLTRLGSQHVTNIDSDLLVEMVRQVGALKLGEYFRGRHLMERYAEELLMSYMFRQEVVARDRARAVIQSLLHEAPSHDFHMDYHLCRAARLEVREMDTPVSDASKLIVRQLDSLTYEGKICPNITDAYRPPYIRFYSRPAATEEALEDDTDTAVSAESGARTAVRESPAAPRNGPEETP